MARRCCWCGTPKVTREHVFGKWMRDMLPDAEFTFTRRLPNGQLVSKMVRLIELQTKHVCRKCNNDWGSDLETRAQKALEKVLLKEIPHSFSPADCKGIADLGFKATVLANA